MSQRSLCSFPSEVLSDLFEIGKRWQLERLAEDNEDEMPFELLVSQICSHTRTVALATPRIWTSIDLHPSSVRERIRAYVARSAAAWLNIRIDMMQSQSPDDEKAINTLLDIVCPHSHRWRRLSILRLFESNGHAIIRHICDSHTPGLQDLSLVVEDIDRENVDALVRHLRSPSIFKSRVQLRFVRLSGLALHLFQPRMDSIVTLHLDETKRVPVKYAKFREIILSSPSLLHLSIYGDIVAPRSWSGLQSDIHTPSLRSLRICGVSGEVYSNVLLVIEAPMLESLTLKMLQEHDLDALGDLADATKFANLKSLTFLDFDVSSYTFERIMRIFQNVTSFATFHSTLLDSHLVELLLDRSETTGRESSRWPMLKSLSFPLDNDDDEIDIAQALITSRKRSGCPVPTIILCASADDEDDGIESKVQGVKVVYSSRPTWPPDFVDRVQDDVFLH